MSWQLQYHFPLEFVEYMKNQGSVKITTMNKEIKQDEIFQDELLCCIISRKVRLSKGDISKLFLAPIFHAQNCSEIRCAALHHLEHTKHNNKHLLVSSLLTKSILSIRKCFELKTRLGCICSCQLVDLQPLQNVSIENVSQHNGYC